MDAQSAWNQMRLGSSVRRPSDKYQAAYALTRYNRDSFSVVSKQRWFGDWIICETRWGIEDLEATDWEIAL